MNIDLTPRTVEPLVSSMGLITKPWYLFFQGQPQKKATAIAAISTVDATDLPTAIALANSNKAKINELITALKGAGIMQQ